ncbi:hypothetical protein N7520_008327 [Penicillium odoratum]|uniref:uncharacterized protein n=1 Tax=Penicillium odoratum TaxID=1167516 RepID=UPI002548D29B|nr:uncharacterized protein N7520_008327 [Penicillium odoratum]KAJ5761171.1 hypothetical protein N7520_008327 [Penicillium odoratum]
MTSQVGAGLAADTDIFKSKSPGLKVLDLCMAPGGFTTAAAKNLTEPMIDGMTLPPEIGGYEVIAKSFCQRIIYSDITMYPTEMGYAGHVPEGHPDARKFETNQPLLGNRYSIVFCGGAVGRDHPRKDYRKDCEGTRLIVSQTVFAMNHLNPGGSIVLLLHRVEAWDTVCILNAFNQFSEIELYKHPKCHAIKSSFYLVARNIDLEHPAAKESVSYWRSLWRYLTFKDIPVPESTLYGSDDAFVQKLIEEFGPYYRKIARPVWKCQAKALRKQSFTR